MADPLPMYVAHPNTIPSQAVEFCHQWFIFEPLNVNILFPDFEYSATRSIDGANTLDNRIGEDLRLPLPRLKDQRDVRHVTPF